MCVECSGVEVAEVFLPDQFAVAVVAVEAFGPEECDDVLSVDGGGAVGVGGFDVALGLGDPAVGGLVPKDVTGAFVDAIESKVVGVAVISAIEELQDTSPPDGGREIH